MSATHALSVYVLISRCVRAGNYLIHSAHLWLCCEIPDYLLEAHIDRETTDSKPLHYIFPMTPIKEYTAYSIANCLQQRKRPLEQIWYVALTQHWLERGGLQGFPYHASAFILSLNFREHAFPRPLFTSDLRQVSLKLPPKNVFWRFIE